MSTLLPTDISLNGLNTTRSQEGRALRAYQDAVHVWTVGYGLTNYDKGLPWKVGPGLVITEAQAEWYLLKSIRENYLPDVHRALSGGTYQHPQGAVDGGLDFHFNCGGILKSSWPKSLGRGDLRAAEANMKSWCRAGGRVLSDLVRRRATDWNIVSAENYGHITGPTNVVPTASGRESYHGYGDVLTAYPTDPSGVHHAGTVAAPPAANATPPVAHPGAIKKGDTGPEVTQVQQQLNAAGVNVPVNGIFDEQTEEAVRKFQQSHPNLGDDGVVGPATDAALTRAKNLRSAVSATTKIATPVVPGAYIGLHQWVSEHAGNIALVGGLLAVGAIVVYLAWTYRYDIAGTVNKWTGHKTA
jgi:lysozyme